MDRRTFLSWVGVGGVASSLPIAIAACSNSGNSPRIETNQSGLSPIGTVETLNAQGQVFRQDAAQGGILVIRDPAKSDNLVAVTPVCSHKGCEMKWGKDAKKFVCPCHGAEFDATGKVVKGPAEAPLKTYEASIQGNTVFVKVG